MKSSNGNLHVSLGNGKLGASALHRIVRWSRRKLGFLRKKGAIYNFSDIETSPFGSSEIQRLVREAGKAAASEAKAGGIPKVFAKNDQVFKQYSDGRIEVIAEAEGLKGRGQAYKIRGVICQKEVEVCAFLQGLI